MLVLKRTEGESIVFHTSQGTITVTIGERGRVAIDAPREVKVLRKELDRHDADRKEQN
jgi:sRNA-binding carbon storage regulator CsrA